MSTTEQLNTALEGRYTIERLIGQGGMATVYLARDLRHHRRVALKVLKPDLNAVLGNDRFLSEIQVTANLQHPNLLPLFDSGVVDQLLFYVMPYVEGESLRARLEREKQLPVSEVVRLTTSMANALDYAHRQGVIHRDLKPENVLLQEGQPLIADFGIALAVSNAGGGRITQTGLSLGTPQYMSPEQATGERAIDARTDQYSLGALAYEMLTGEPPHVGATSQAIIARLLTETPRPIRAVRASVPMHIEAAVSRALEKLPADRWSTTREFADALTNVSMTSATVSGDGAGVAHSSANSRTARVREAVAWVVALSGLAAAGYLATRTPTVAARTSPMMFDIPFPPGMVYTNLGGAGNLALDRGGTTIAFQLRDSTALNAVYLRRLDGASIVRVSGTENAGAPTFSSDGRELRFFNAGTTDTLLTQIYTVPITGGERRIWVTTPSYAARWSERDGGPLVIAARGGLRTAPAEGGTTTLLRRSDSVYRRFAFPEALPGGNAALVGLFVGGTSLDSSYLAHVALKDGTVQRLSIKGVKPRYSPTGHLMWATPGGELWAATWSPSTPLENGPPFRVAEGLYVGPGGGASYSISDNGVLVYTEGQSALTGGMRVVVAVNRAGIERAVTVDSAYQQHPRLSLDGKTLLVSRGVNAEASLPLPDIWRVDLARGVPERLTLDSTSMRPYWFPDGERVAYIRRHGADSSIAFVRRADGTGAPLRIGTRGVFVRGVAVSPRGDYLALAVGGVDSNGGDDVWLVHVDSLNAPHPFLNAPYIERTPRFSPDGRWLAYESTRDGRGEVFVRALTGGAEMKISVDGGREPVWSRKGDELFFRSDRFLMAARVSFAGRPTVVGLSRLFDANRYVSSGYGQYDVMPDAKEFLFVREGQIAPLVSADRLRVIVDWPLLARTPR